MKDCDKGWHTGDCCCNCVNQIKLMKHPWNKKIGKGSITDQMGYVCNATFDDGSNMGAAVFFEKEHGYCEMHIRNK